MTEGQRNLGILVAIAVVGVMFAGPFGLATLTLSLLINVVFTVLIGWSMYAWHQRNHHSLSAMPMGWRLLLQSSGILLFIVFVTGTVYPNWSGDSPVAFFALLAACIVGLWAAWQYKP